MPRDATGAMIPATGGPTFTPGPDPTFDAASPRAPKSATPPSSATGQTASQKVHGTFEDFEREVGRAVSNGEMTPEVAQARLKRAASILQTR